MTSKTTPPAPAPGGSTHEPAPWRAGYASDVDVGGSEDGAVGFMSALRRFRHRHGLQPTTQAPVLSTDDLDDLRATDAPRPDPFADLADDPA